MCKNRYDSFITLVRLGIGTSDISTNSITDAKISENIGWPAIQNLAYQHGLLGVIIDGIEKLPASNRLPQALLLQWIGEVMQNYEARYKAYSKAIVELAQFYHCHGFKMMVLKGYACSLDWPKPEHRPCGDIDIWQFGKQKEADETLRQAQGSGFKIDKSHHHHTVFNWGDFTIENHYDFVNVHAHRSSAELEKVFKELGQDDSHYVELKDASTGSVSKVYLPSPNLHALFLVKHMVSHFAAAEISLRQVLDWAFFAEKHTKEIDWVWLDEMLEKYSMKDFFNCINGICVEDLGFAPEIFPSVQFLPDLKEKVLDDILEPKFTSDEPKGFMPRMIYKYKRWQGNAWKQEMCYGESRWEMFWTGIWAKMLKPASF